jgi:hypothetical protein
VWQRLVTVERLGFIGRCSQAGRGLPDSDRLKVTSTSCRQVRTVIAWATRTVILCPGIARQDDAENSRRSRNGDDQYAGQGMLGRCL